MKGNGLCMGAQLKRRGGVVHVKGLICVKGLDSYNRVCLCNGIFTCVRVNCLHIVGALVGYPWCRMGAINKCKRESCVEALGQFCP